MHWTDGSASHLQYPCMYFPVPKMGVSVALTTCYCVCVILADVEKFWASSICLKSIAIGFMLFTATFVRSVFSLILSWTKFPYAVDLKIHIIDMKILTVGSSVDWWSERFDLATRYFQQERNPYLVCSLDSMRWINNTLLILQYCIKRVYLLLDSVTSFL